MEEQKKEKVIIVGAGIGGLTVAHYLCTQENKYDIEIYERNDEVGGLARSQRDSTSKCAMEYCWRVFFGFYKHFFETLSQIDCLSTLVPYRDKVINDTSLKYKDYFILAWYLWYGLSSCDERLNQLDNWQWSDILKHTSENHVLRQVGPWLGMDRLKASFKSVIKVGFEYNILRNEQNYVTNQPTSEAIFDPWVIHLKKKGVQIFLNHEVTEITPKQIVIRHIPTNRLQILTDFDHRVLALPIETLASLSQYKWYMTPKQQQNVKTLSETCLHMQVSLQIYFNRPIFLGNRCILHSDAFNCVANNSFLITNSEWDLIILQYDQVYLANKLCTNKKEIKGGWSIAVCTAYRKGVQIKKPFVACTEEEIHEEIWAQLKQSQQLNRMIQKYNEGLTLHNIEKECTVYWAPLWPDFKYNENEKRIVMKEPKFTNNAGSWALRPSYRTLDNKVWIATAYVQETIDIFSMEAACLAGKKVASGIMKHFSLDTSILPRSRLFAVWRWIDKIFYHFHFPNLTLFCFLGLVIFLLYWILFA